SIESQSLTKLRATRIYLRGGALHDSDSLVMRVAAGGVFDRADRKVQLTNDSQNLARILGLQPLFGRFVGNRNHQPIVLQTSEAGRAYPIFVALGGEGRLQLLLDLVPSIHV